MGTLRSEDSDGGENVALKLSLFSFNLYLVKFIPTYLPCQI